MKFPNRLRWVWLSLAVVLLDRVSKGLIESQTSESWRHAVIPHFIYLVHSRNPGIAFSIFANSSSPALRVLLIVGALLIIAILSWLLVTGSKLSSLNAAGLALLLGGATGNLTDRILHGAVTDFLEVFLGSYRWPAFNVADSAITLGAILLIFDVLFSRQHQTAE